MNAVFPKSLYTANLTNGEAVTLQDSIEASDQKWVFVPTGDEAGSCSIRTISGQALDLDTGQSKIQLYDYLGYDNQRWIIQRHEDGTASILSIYNRLALAVSEDGSRLVLEAEQDGEQRQRWIVGL
ncbi:Ricin-type beta-trefoil lectin domain protein [compost metagenome]